MAIRQRVRRTLVRGSRAWYRWRGPRAMGPPQPPTCPSGWRTAPPDYVGLGAQKAGTSWWDGLIHLHPAVHRVRGQPKELHYFDRSWEQPFDDAAIERYQRYFPRPEGGIAGEWTPGYLIDFWTPELIARAAPDVKVLILLRDPLARFVSGLTHQLATSRKPLSHRDIQGAFQRGLYAPQLRRVFAAFPHERVLIGQYEACRSDPLAQLARTYEFLGLEPFRPDDDALRGEVNPTTGRKYELPGPLREALLSGYRHDIEQVRRMLPDVDLSLWPSVAEMGLAET